MDTQAETLRLLSLAADWELSDSEFQELSELIEHSQNSESYLEFMRLHLTLAECNAPVREFSMEELRAVTAVENEFQKYENDSVGQLSHENSEKQPRTSKRVRLFRRSHWLSFMCGLAASVLLLFALRHTQSSKEPAENQIPSLAESYNQEAKSYAARIVKKIDCEWSTDRWSISTSDQLQVNEWINLTSGLLTLEFKEGATVTLQGPVSASPTSGNSIHLEHGGLTAHVPESAHGFTVRTNKGEIVDLGTEFGVLASEDGSLETHVFEGEVITRIDSLTENRNPDGVSLKAGQSQLVSLSGEIRSASADPAKFLRLSFGSKTGLSQHPPVERVLAQWLAADGRVQLDTNGKVSAWGDNLTPYNEVAEDTWQVHRLLRPRWYEDAINGHPAILFGGNSKLISEPLKLGSNVTAVVVFRLLSERVSPAFSQLYKKPIRLSRPDLGLQLLNLHGPPHPVIQINEDLSLTGRVHLGPDPDNLFHNNTGVISSVPVADGMPHIVVYSFDSSASEAHLFLDGMLSGIVEDAVGLEQTFTPRYIGQHPSRTNHGFPGYIAEVLLYDAVLQVNEVSAITSWLGEKYDIPVTQHE